MNRKDMYSYIKKNNLQEIIKERFGDNFTRISNIKLEKFIQNDLAGLTNKTKVIKDNSTKTDSKETINDSKSDKDFTFVSQMNTVQMVLANTAIQKLINILSKKHILLKSEIEYIYKKDNL